MQEIKGFWYNATEMLEVDSSHKILNYKGSSGNVVVPLSQVKQVRIYEGVVIVDYKKSSRLKYKSKIQDIKELAMTFKENGIDVVHKN